MEEVIIRLRKVRDEKKIDLYRTFLKHSQEISQEKEVILKLLCSGKIPVNNDLTKKRKSSDASLGKEKLSPEQKRLSTEFEQFLSAEGYTYDANRLRKDQLLELLKKRGIQGFNMKHLKSEMIESLKDSFLVTESSKMLPNEVSKCALANLQSPDLTVKKTPGRAGSLMSEFRNIVAGSNSQSQPNNDWIAKEFEKRQSRHRDSHLRKLDGSTLCDNVTAKEEEHCEKFDSSSRDSEQEIVEKTKPIWNEVTSPSPAKSSVKAESLTEPQDQKTIELGNLLAGPDVNHIAEENSSVQDKLASCNTGEQTTLESKKETCEKVLNSGVKPSVVKKTGIFTMFSKSGQNSSNDATKSASLKAKEETGQSNKISSLPKPSASTPAVPPSANVSANPIVEPEVKEIPRSVEATNDVGKKSPAQEYVINIRDDSSDEGNSDTDSENNDKKQQNIPDWARGEQLKLALEKQYGLNGHIPLDPDKIFPEVQTCSLEEIFGRREGLTRKYSNRTSSAHWDADQLTLVEKRQYRLHMGYDQQPSSKLVCN